MLRVEDLKIGMIVSKSDLADVFGMYIFLADYDTATYTGRIIHLCTEEDRDSDSRIGELEKENKEIVVYFHSLSSQNDFYAEESDNDEWCG